MDDAKCAECAVTFTPTRAWQTFCCAAHQRAFHNRNQKRGQVLLPFAQTWRAGKHGGSEACKFSLAQMAALLDRWNAEDRAAGRSPSFVVTKKMADGWRAVDLN